MIDPSPFPDRLPDDTDSAFEEFKKLIARKARRSPFRSGRTPKRRDRYQIVYGHRRWRACRDLGIKVKAILTELTDAELVVAQGIENAARQDLSWIERALFVAEWTRRASRRGISAPRFSGRSRACAFASGLPRYSNRFNRGYWPRPQSRPSSLG